MAVVAVVAAAGLMGYLNHPNPFLMRRGHEGPWGHVRHEALIPTSYPEGYPKMQVTPVTVTHRCFAVD